MAALNAENKEKTVTLDFSFLGDNEFKGFMISSGEKADQFLKTDLSSAKLKDFSHKMKAKDGFSILLELN